MTVPPTTAPTEPTSAPGTTGRGSEQTMHVEDRPAVATPAAEKSIRVTVNGTVHERTVSVRRSLVEFLREDLGLTGTHVGCEHGVCGACTVLMDGEPIRACLMFAVQADGAEFTTVEGLAEGDRLHPIQQAFWDHHGLQCGFCTPGILLTTYDFLRDNRGADEAEIREAVSGNLCRCTGYQGIVRSVQAADETWER
ncbi:(2Fe-2S)-binding protein [Geodermatophilus ruber]|uniref:Carbon-monoxide dehydrogenase small subunit n=1 Tax=Geodermatophilus ruber TaxID=504800 RepID=A0A1I4HE92_9ACTN|nr:(2Fe-2S)-binding protein [Geodermatophilus ruber]SFL40003.1 carbon-monoxide dehydrogenase small subunit [Geodermatophilus ruber]